MRILLCYGINIWGHISKERMQRLIKEYVLHDLDFLDFNTYVDCMKGKLTIRVKKGKRSQKQDVLELIHNNISEPITFTTMGG